MVWGTPEYGLFLNGFAVLANGFCAWWLKDYVKQKEELKNTEISNIRSIVEAKEAQIDNLKTERDKLSKEAAPALAGHVRTLSDSLESMAKTLQKEKKNHDELESLARERGVESEEARIENLAVCQANEQLTERVKEMQETIQTLKLESSLFSSPAWLSSTGTLADMSGSGQTFPPAKRPFRIRKEGIITPNLDRTFENTKDPKNK